VAKEVIQEVLGDLQDLKTPLFPKDTISLALAGRLDLDFELPFHTQNFFQSMLSF